MLSQRYRYGASGVTCVLTHALFAALVLVAAVIPSSSLAEDVAAYLFWQEGCPHCDRAKAALREIEADTPELRLTQLQLGISEEIDALFMHTIERVAAGQAAVPLFVVGDQAVVGFSAGGGTATRYRALIKACLAGPCPDIVRPVSPRTQAPSPSSDRLRASVPETITLPVIGDVSVRGLSLPLLTVVLAAVDGFNPCAMWVLAILIGFLLGVQDRRRMWTLGLVFLAATGAMYFAFMAAWLNVILWIGALSWIRLAIGALAVAAGGYYLREFWTNPEGVCRVTPSARRRTIMQRFQALVEEPSLIVASLGIAVLAITVNMIELVCSAGVPAIFTQMLAMHDVPTTAYYGYLLLYLAVFLLDDIAIFVTAMVVLRSVAATGGFARFSHLIGGVVLLALGAVMLLRPDLLA